jgi:hypothetical protein
MGQFQMTAQSLVCNEDLMIIHFVPAGMKIRGSPAKILSEYMAAWLSPNALLYQEIQYDLSSASSANSHLQSPSEMFTGGFEEG